MREPTKPTLQKEPDGSNVEIQQYEIDQLIAMKRDSLMKLVSNGGMEIQTAEAKQVQLLIAKLFGIDKSYIKGKNRNTRPLTLRAIGIYAYILHEKLRMSQVEITEHYKGEISNSTVHRWISRGKEEVENNPTTKKLYDSIEYIGL